MSELGRASEPIIQTLLAALASTAPALGSAQATGTKGVTDSICDFKIRVTLSRDNSQAYRQDSYYTYTDGIDRGRTWLVVCGRKLDRYTLIDEHRAPLDSPSD